MERRVTPPRWVTSPTWGPPPPCKQALSRRYLAKLTVIWENHTELREDCLFMADHRLGHR